MLRLLMSLVLVILLAGCASNAVRLGFSEKEWHRLNDQQRQLNLSHYKIIKKRFTESSKDKIFNGPTLSIYLLKGSAMMPPFLKRYDFSTKILTVLPGTCRKVVLESVDTRNQVPMGMCYNGLELSLDPSHYDLDKSQGTVHLSYNPIWKRGFTYSNIHSSGYVRLKNASITIKAIPEDKLKTHNDKNTRH